MSCNPRISNGAVPFNYVEKTEKKETKTFSRRKWKRKKNKNKKFPQNLKKKKNKSQSNVISDQLRKKGRKKKTQSNWYHEIPLRSNSEAEQFSLYFFLGLKTIEMLAKLGSSKGFYQIFYFYFLNFLSFFFFFFPGFYMLC